MLAASLAVRLLLLFSASATPSAVHDDSLADVQLDWERLGSSDVGELNLYGEDFDDDAMDPDEVGWLFAQLDTNADGLLSTNELREALQLQARTYLDSVREASVSESAMLLDSADADGDGHLSVVEFESAAHMYIHHAEAMERPALFAFADADADGHLTASELHALLFPEWSARAPELRRFLRAHVCAAHDTDADAFLSVDELYPWHRRARGMAPHWLGAAAGEGDLPPAGSFSDGLQRREWPGRAGGGDDPVLAEQEEEHEYTAHAHAFERHDRNGDGVLDEAELGEYLVPESTADGAQVSLQHLLQAELQRLQTALRLGTHAATHAQGLPMQHGGGGEAAEDAELSFDLEQALALGALFVRSFEVLRAQLGHARQG